jgi:hypothetical protein
MSDEQITRAALALAMIAIQDFASTHHAELACDVLVYEALAGTRIEDALLPGSKIETLIQMVSAVRPAPFEIVKLIVVNACLTHARERITKLWDANHAEAQDK